MFTKRSVLRSLVLIIVFILMGCRTVSDEKQDMEEDDEIVEEEMDEIDEKLSSLTLEEKIGQLLIVGVEGENFSERERYQLNTNKVGGFIFFSRNIKDEEQFLSLLNQLKTEKESDIPLFLSIDEEGGTVSRLSTFYGALPEMEDLGDLNDEEIAYEYGRNLGMRLDGFG